MKKLHKLLYSLLLLVPIVLFSCKQSGEKNLLPTDIVKNPNSASGNIESDLPAIEFEKDLYDFGRILQGEKVSYSFKFTNSGKSDLVISKVTSSCGCTVGSFPKEPIRSGESGKIEVKFDSEGRKGFQSKTVTVLSNSQPSASTLRIKAKVVLPGE